MDWFKHKVWLLLLLLAAGGCFRYSFTGTSIPPGVNTIFIPFFADQSNSGLGDLTNRLNDALIDRFVNQSRLQLANTEADADAFLEGVIVSYTNRPFSIAGDEQADQNEVTITVRATFAYASKSDAEWSKSFTGKFTYDPITSPIEGENEAASRALQQIANNMFNDAVSNW